MPAHNQQAVVIRQIGDECLRQVSKPVLDINAPEFLANRDRLMLALTQFRAASGFGRAISAPQIGVNDRLIAVILAHDRQFFMINPEITWHSEEQFTLWDDCMKQPHHHHRHRRHGQHWHG
jgi:peptide deformylase